MMSQDSCFDRDFNCRGRCSLVFGTSDRVVELWRSGVKMGWEGFCVCDVERAESWEVYTFYQTKCLSVQDSGIGDLWKMHIWTALCMDSFFCWTAFRMDHTFARSITFSAFPYYIFSDFHLISPFIYLDQGVSKIKLYWVYIKMVLDLSSAIIHI